MSSQLIALAVLVPLLFMFGMVASHRPTSGRYLSARWAMSLAVAIVGIAIICAWLLPLTVFVAIGLVFLAFMGGRSALAWS